MNRHSYLIAEDEPALAREFAGLMQQYWPDAECVGIAANGDDALDMARRMRPDAVFLDVRMPGCDGIKLAQTLCEGPRVPLMVFVTAFDQYALDAFGAAALDYLLKPVEPERLAICVARLKERLAHEQTPALGVLTTQLQDVLARMNQDKKPLRYIRAGTESSVKLIPVDDVLFFEARDKYVSVITTAGETLIRTALCDLRADLDPDQFWQVHRGAIVNARAIVSADRDGLGRIRLNLRDHPHKITVSRSFAHYFKPM